MHLLDHFANEFPEFTVEHRGGEYAPGPPPLPVTMPSPVVTEGEACSARLCQYLRRVVVRAVCFVSGVNGNSTREKENKGG